MKTTIICPNCKNILQFKYNFRKKPFRIKCFKCLIIYQYNMLKHTLEEVKTPYTTATELHNPLLKLLIESEPRFLIVATIEYPPTHEEFVCKTNTFYYYITSTHIKIGLIKGFDKLSNSLEYMVSIHYINSSERYIALKKCLKSLQFESVWPTMKELVWRRNKFVVVNI